MNSYRCDFSLPFRKDLSRSISWISNFNFRDKMNLDLRDLNSELAAI